MHFKVPLPNCTQYITFNSILQFLVCASYPYVYLHRPMKVTLIDHRRRTSQGLASSSDDTDFKKSPSVDSGDSLSHMVKEKLLIETSSVTLHVEQEQRRDGRGLDGGDGEVQTSKACLPTSTTTAYTHLSANTLEVGASSVVEPTQLTVKDTAKSTVLKAEPHVCVTSVKKSNAQQYAQSPASDSPMLRVYRVLSEWCSPETCRLLGEGWSERDVSQLSYAEASLVERQQPKGHTVQAVNQTDDSSQPGSVCSGVRETEHVHVRKTYEILH